MYKPIHLLMISTANNNKYYDFFPNGDNTFTVKYGRVSSTEQTKTYPISQWEKIYKSKIAKGYVDKSDLVEDLIQTIKPKSKKEYQEIQNKAIKDIIERLQAKANKTVADNYKVTSNQVTQKMIDTAQDLLDSLIGFSGSIEDFNNNLLELFTIIPRKMKKVNDYLITSKDEFEKIITREAELLDTMRGQVFQNTIKDEEIEENNFTHPYTLLEALGLEIDTITLDEENMIKKLMGQNSHLFKNAWKVIHINSNNNFEQYKKDKNIDKTKLFWHGSRGCNWFSILSQSLKIRLAGIATNGSLFGSEGIYFANNVLKSRNYCGMRGSYWTSGTDSTGFVALFETAYGDNPYNVYSFDSKYYTMNEKKLNEIQNNATCLHARAGTKLDGSWSQLLNDEIIFYNENAVTIRYLVEIM